MPEAPAARGAIGRSTYEAVRKHIEQGKKATEAFALVAEVTGRSKATVQTAYYRIARSLPDGGGVKIRPRSSAQTRYEERHPSRPSASEHRTGAQRTPQPRAELNRRRRRSSHSSSAARPRRSSRTSLASRRS